MCALHLQCSHASGNSCTYNEQHLSLLQAGIHKRVGAAVCMTHVFLFRPYLIVMLAMG